MNIEASGLSRSIDLKNAVVKKFGQPTSSVAQYDDWKLNDGFSILGQFVAESITYMVHIESPRYAEAQRQIELKKRARLQM